jgi:hypothetical protein
MSAPCWCGERLLLGRAGRGAGGPAGGPAGRRNLNGPAGRRAGGPPLRSQPQRRLQRDCNTVILPGPGPDHPRSLRRPAPPRPAPPRPAQHCDTLVAAAGPRSSAPTRPPACTPACLPAHPRVDARYPAAPRAQATDDLGSARPPTPCGRADGGIGRRAPRGKGTIAREAALVRFNPQANVPYSGRLRRQTKPVIQLSSTGHRGRPRPSSLAAAPPGSRRRQDREAGARRLPAAERAPPRAVGGGVTTERSRGLAPCAARRRAARRQP